MGTQLVELALVLPVLLLFFGAIAEFGCFFYTYSTLAKAVRAGARYTINRPFDSTSIDGARNLAIYGDQSAACAGTPVVSNLQCANLDIKQTTSGGVTLVTVKIINYQYKPLLDLGKLTGMASASLNIDVSPSATMKYVY
jgi:Flp pilus assembly protein TadG